MVLLVDLKKDYDSVKWEFLLSIMHIMRFPHKWIAWVQVYVTTPSFSVLVKWDADQEFRSSNSYIDIEGYEREKH